MTHTIHQHIVWPKVSVLMPAYNAELYIDQAIQSILDQTFEDFECIIIDDCSTDRTWEIIQRYADQDDRIIAIRNEHNLKICKTLNKWIALARGQYIARMDADDISLPQRFQLQVDYLDAHDEVGIVWGSMQMFNDLWVIGTRTYHQSDVEIRRHIFRYSPFCHPAVMIRSSALELSGWYNESWVFAEDYDLYFRLGQYCEFANINTLIIKYRIVTSSMTWSKADYMEYCTQYIKLKAVFEYWYTMSWWDKLYCVTQLCSMLIIRWKFRIWLFNTLRNTSW